MPAEQITMKQKANELKEKNKVSDGELFEMVLTLSNQVLLRFSPSAPTYG
jgi:hypothetical protein